MPNRIDQVQFIKGTDGVSFHLTATLYDEDYAVELFMHIRRWIAEGRGQMLPVQMLPGPSKVPTVFAAVPDPEKAQRRLAAIPAASVALVLKPGDRLRCFVCQSAYTQDKIRAHLENHDSVVANDSSVAKCAVVSAATSVVVNGQAVEDNADLTEQAVEVPADLPAELLAATNFRQVMIWMVANKVDDPAEILRRCESWRVHIPAVARLPQGSLPDRISRALTVLQMEQAAK